MSDEETNPAKVYWGQLEDVLAEEAAHVDALRSADPEAQRQNPAGLPIGLALSGGGIRSATFSLGALQALAQRGLLRRIDYLSTVSGGGYVGCWLSCILHHTRASNASDAIGGVEKLIAPPAIRERDDEPTEIRFLRAYSNYLTPRIGWSGDTLAALTGFACNLLLNLVPAAATIALALSLVHVLGFVAGTWLRVSYVRNSMDGFAGALGL